MGRSRFAVANRMKRDVLGELVEVGLLVFDRARTSVRVWDVGGGQRIRSGSYACWRLCP